MTGHDALPVDHIGPAALPQIDAADDIVERIVLIDAHHVENGFTVLLHRHSHCNAQLILKDGGGIDCQRIRFLQQGQKAAVQAFRRAVDSLRQPSVQAVEGDCVKLIDLCRFFQHRRAFRLHCPGLVCPRAHSGIAGNGHHPVGQHMNVGFHCLGRLTGHWLKAVQQDIVGK